MVAVTGSVLREKINSPLLKECIDGTSQPLLQPMLPKSDSPGVHRHLFHKGIMRKSNRTKTSSSPWYLVSKLQLLSGALLLCWPILMVLSSSASPYAAVKSLLVLILSSETGNFAFPRSQVLELSFNVKIAEAFTKS